MDETELLPRDALTTFLYLLMRDALPTGKVRGLIDQAVAAEQPSFSAPELHGLAARYAIDLVGVVDAEVVEEEGGEEDEPALVQRIRAGSNGMLMRDEWGADFTPAMREWLDLFDDRVARLPTFVEAVNAAADEGMEADEETAQYVAEQARLRMERKAES